MNKKLSKKALALVLAVLMLVALFAGCGNSNSGSGNTGSGTASGSGTSSGGNSSSGSGTSSGGSTSTGSGASSGSTSTGSGDAGSGDSGAEPVVDEGPYCLAAGKFEVDPANGLPTAHYEYAQPLSTTDEVFTKWSTCYTPQYIPDEGWGSIPTWRDVETYTGVHIEYNIIASSTRSQNFSVLLASDDLDDIMDQGGSFYSSGTLKDAVEEGYFANLYDYQDYLPNYLYMVNYFGKDKPDVRAKVFYDETTIPSLYGMNHDPCPAEGYLLRQDWMDAMDMGPAINVKTYDKLEEVLLAMKANYSTPDREIYPLFINDVGEVYQSALFGGFNTTIYASALSYPRVVDGRVEFCGTTSDDFDAMTLLNKWFSEGLISPNFSSFVAGGDYDCGLYDDGLGCHMMLPSSISTTEQLSENPNCRWEPIERTRKTEDQVMKYGYVKPRDCYHYGSVNISAKCANIALAVSWIDWAFSEFGSEFVSWGTQGYLWDYNEEGERRLTEWALTHEAGVSWIVCIYGTCALIECALMHNLRNYYYDGGLRCLDAIEVWTLKDYKGEYDWPSVVKLSDEEREETTSLLADLNTYFAENYMAFATGDRPLSDWNAYLDTMNECGLSRVVELYQAAYDRYIAGA